MNQNTSITEAEATFLKLNDVKDLVPPAGYTYVPDPVQPTTAVGYYSGAVEDGGDEYYFEAFLDPINPLKDSAYHVDVCLEAASKQEVRALLTRLLDWWAERETEQRALAEQAAR